MTERWETFGVGFMCGVAFTSIFVVVLIQICG